MPDVQELSAGDMDVVERMKNLPDDVLFGEEQPDTKAGQERTDDPEAPDEIRDEPPAEEVEAKDAKQQEPAEEEADPEFEIPDAEGGEPRKVKLSELLEAEREVSAFKEEKAAILTRVQTEATTQAQGMVQQTRAAMTEVGHQLKAVLQVMQPPRPPPVEWLNPQSQSYNPDQYHLARAQFEQNAQLYNFVQQASQGIARNQVALDEQRDEREFKALAPHWPEFTDPVKGQATQHAFLEGMHKAYGFTFEELDSVMVDHRQALVARDALKWREHEAKAKAAKTSLKEKVVATAKPAKQAPNNANAKTLTTEQSNYMNARKALKANGKDMGAAAKGMLRFL